MVNTLVIDIIPPKSVLWWWWWTIIHTDPICFSCFESDFTWYFQWTFFKIKNVGKIKNVKNVKNVPWIKNVKKC